MGLINPKAYASEKGSSYHLVQPTVVMGQYRPHLISEKQTGI